MKKGKLYLIPTPIDGNDFKTTLTTRDIEIVSTLKYLIVETPKTARNYLASIELDNPIQEIDMKIFDEHSSLENIQELIQPLLAGYNMGLMTDAGTPCIADPGEEIVLMCQRLDIEIVPMIGPSSITLALMASGLDGEKFIFNGYLPRKPNKRQKELRRLQHKILNNEGTQIFIEAPYRNQVMFDDIMKLDGDLYLCIGEKIGSHNSKMITKPISKWKEENKKLDKVPIIYLLGKGYEEA
jgi:16S rRNA (cytidine1402-2'-O)-methyltransferase